MNVGKTSVGKMSIGKMSLDESWSTAYYTVQEVSYLISSLS